MLSNHSLLVLIIIDLTFIPMLHIFGLPLKISYILLPLFVLYNTRNGSFQANKTVVNLTIGFATLFIITLIGHFVYLTFYDGISHSATIRSLLIYLIAPFALMTGYSSRPKSFTVFVYIGIAYFLATLLFSIFYEQLSGVTRFYGIGTQIEYYQFRSQGLFSNSNISALFATIIYLFVVVSIKNNFSRVSNIAFYVLATATLATILILVSRNQLLAFMLITTIFFLSKLNKKNLVPTIFTVFLATAIFVSFHRDIDRLSASYLGYSPLSSIQNGFSSLTDTSNKTNSLIRPIRTLEETMARTYKSPLIGSGFDTNTEQPFNPVLFHNDWFYILTSAGVLGLVVFSFIVYQIGRVDLLLTIPFVLPGMTNSFFFAPSHLCLLLILVGITTKLNRTKGDNS